MPKDWYGEKYCCNQLSFNDINFDDIINLELERDMQAQRELLFQLTGIPKGML